MVVFLNYCLLIIIKQEVIWRERQVIFFSGHNNHMSRLLVTQLMLFISVSFIMFLSRRLVIFRIFASEWELVLVGTLWRCIWSHYILLIGNITIKVMHDLLCSHTITSMICTVNIMFYKVSSYNDQKLLLLAHEINILSTWTFAVIVSSVIKEKTTDWSN